MTALLDNVFLKTLRDQRFSLMWWSLGIAVLVVVTVLFYPSLRDTEGLDEIVEQMPEALWRAFAGSSKDFTSPQGFLNSQLFVLMVPLLFLVFTLSAGSGAIAGEEERGTLDVLLSNPVRRWEVLLEKFAAMIAGMAVLSVALWLSTLASAKVVGMDIGTWRVAEATLSAAFLGIAYGAIALVFGCASGKRGLSISLTGALAVAAYFVNALGPVVDGMDEKISPFYYYIGSDPLSNGLDPFHVGILVGMALAGLVAALAAFERRDLTT